MAKKDKKKGAHRILYKRGPEGEAIMPDEQTATDLGEQVVYLHAQLSDAQAEPQQVKERAEKTETALAEMTTRAEAAEDTLTAERERHEKEFTDVAAQSERFRQGMVKAQNERNDLRDTVANLKVELVVAQEKIHGHEEWLKADSQYAENQRLKVELADSESIRHAEKEILIAEIAAHTATRAELAAARQEAVDLQAGFDLRWRADMRAIKAWQDSTGRKLVWPDHADLCVWLMGELAEAEDGCQVSTGGLVGDMEGERVRTISADQYFGDDDPNQIRAADELKLRTAAITLAELPKERLAHGFVVTSDSPATLENARLALASISGLLIGWWCDESTPPEQVSRPGEQCNCAHHDKSAQQPPSGTMTIEQALVLLFAILKRNHGDDWGPEPIAALALEFVRIDRVAEIRALEWCKDFVLPLIGEERYGFGVERIERRLKEINANQDD